MSRTIRQKLDQLADMERRNDQRIADFRTEEEQREHKRSRLAWIEGYTTEKPGYEGVRDQIIERYRRDLKIDKEA